MGIRDRLRGAYLALVRGLLDLCMAVGDRCCDRLDREEERRARERERRRLLAAIDLFLDEQRSA